MAFIGELADTRMESPTWDTLFPFILKLRDTTFNNKHERRATHCAVHSSIVANGADLRQAGLTLRVPALIPYPSYVWVGFYNGKADSLLETIKGDDNSMDEVKEVKAGENDENGNDNDGASSSVIDYYRRLSDTRIVINFFRGGSYLLDDVPKEILDEYEAAESKGKAFNRLLKGRYEGVKLG